MGELGVYGVCLYENAPHATFTFLLTNPLSVAVYVEYATFDGSATVTDGDYAPANNWVEIPAGETIATVYVPILDDDLVEGTEGFSMQILRVTGAQPTVSREFATAMIFDNDDDDQAPVNVRADSDNDGQVDSDDDAAEDGGRSHVVFVNTDDDNANGTVDVDETEIAGENNLARVSLIPGPCPCEDARYRISKGGAIRLWTTAGKDVELDLTADDGSPKEWTEENLPSEVWVEGITAGGTASLTVVRSAPDGNGNHSDTATFLLKDIDIDLRGVDDSTELTVGGLLDLNDDDSDRNGQSDHVQSYEVLWEDLWQIYLQSPTSLEAPDAIENGTFFFDFDPTAVRLFTTRTKAPSSQVMPGDVTLAEMANYPSHTPDHKLYIEAVGVGRHEIALGFKRDGEVIHEDRFAVTVLDVEVTKAPNFLFAGSQYHTPVTFEVSGVENIYVHSAELLVQWREEETGLFWSKGTYSLGSNYAVDDGFGAEKGWGTGNVYTAFVAPGVLANGVLISDGLRSDDIYLGISIDVSLVDPADPENPQPVGATLTLQTDLSPNDLLMAEEWHKPTWYYSADAFVIDMPPLDPNGEGGANNHAWRELSLTSGPQAINESGTGQLIKWEGQDPDTAVQLTSGNLYWDDNDHDVDPVADEDSDGLVEDIVQVSATLSRDQTTQLPENPASYLNRYYGFARGLYWFTGYRGREIPWMNVPFFPPVYAMDLSGAGSTAIADIRLFAGGKGKITLETVHEGQTPAGSNDVGLKTLEVVSAAAELVAPSVGFGVKLMELAVTVEDAQAAMASYPAAEGVIHSVVGKVDASGISLPAGASQFKVSTGQAAESDGTYRGSIGIDATGLDLSVGDLWYGFLSMNAVVYNRAEEDKHAKAVTQVTVPEQSHIDSVDGNEKTSSWEQALVKFW